MKIIDYIKKIVASIKKVKKEFILGFLLGFFIGLFLIFWSISMIFNIVINSPVNLPILDYITISLTLFGFTLIGGIFEKKKPDEVIPIIKSLFRDSLIFLGSGVSFLLAFSLVPFIKTDLKIIFQIAYILGTIFFAIAIFSLLTDLLSFYLQLKRAEAVN